MIALFDIGSTLIEGPPYGPARRLAEMLGWQDRVASIERVLFRAPSSNPRELAEILVGASSGDLPAVEKACTELWNAQLSEAYTLPGARECLERLGDTPRAYLSNIWPPFYEHFRRSFPEEMSRPQFLSFRLGLSKPDPALFDCVLHELGAPANEVVMIGDTYANDIAPAIALGMRTVWVLHRPEKERAALVRVLNGDAPRPDITLSSIGELDLGLLKNGD